jgi:hypothetical protein
MLSGKGTVLISQKQNEHLTYQIYDHKPEYVQTLNQAALELGYDSLIHYLEEKSTALEFHGNLLYACTEELIHLIPNTTLRISKDYQLFFFTELEDTNNTEKTIELSPLPKTKEPYEILIQLKRGQNLIIPSHTAANPYEYCLGLSYYSPQGEPCGELWQDLQGEYFFSNNTESEIYNHDGKKYGYYINREDMSIRYLERAGGLEEAALDAWREMIKQKACLYFLGLQNVEHVYGSYSRRSAFIFNSQDELIMHYRTTDIGASHIADYIRIRLGDYLQESGEQFVDVKILLADGDHNAQTYIPNEAFSDKRLNSYGFHLILKPFAEMLALSKLSPEDKINLDAKEISRTAKLINNLKKKLSILNPASILSGFWRYKNSPEELFTRIKNNISVLGLNNEMIRTGKREFEFQQSFSISKESLKDFPNKSLIKLDTGIDKLIGLKDFKCSLREVYNGYATYILDEYNSNRRLYLKFPKNLQSNNFHLEPSFLLAKLLFGFDTNHKLISKYGQQDNDSRTEEKNFQHGITYNALREQVIYAPFDLKICELGFEKELGNYLIAEVLSIKNAITSENLYILFAYLDEVPVHKPGTLIAKHAALCKAGSSGLSTAPHLHFETRFAKNWDLYFEARSIDPIIVFCYLLNQE